MKATIDAYNLHRIAYLTEAWSTTRCPFFLKLKPKKISFTGCRIQPPFHIKTSQEIPFYAEPHPMEHCLWKTMVKHFLIGMFGVETEAPYNISILHVLACHK
jgi:hypothetical protein